MKTDDKLENIDSEDIDDLLIEIEKSFEISFADAELSSITTFGQLCDLVMEKIKLENVDSCTTQQAFYKLRNAISITLQIDHKSISTDLPLTVILPHKERRHRTKKLERHLRIKLNILSPPDWLITTLGMHCLLPQAGYLWIPL
ncbi:acyl carrier protein [Sphingobacterium chuzhouense]|uniref:Acyl carrier protein n=1 Tax=Sphingobacterium chuzhouense TaxID=1742264 RepID=A0ABR7XU99_9SPHI|nr:acyl carrier protein [Sphingobacterium chuzhouense]MBD1422629.1 acyl carrier protein [Sphingobacterium chuzhouense]